MTRSLRYAAVSVLWLITAATGSAMPPQHLQAVDQAVEDLDPLAKSMRRIEPGLDQYGQHSSLFRRVGRAGALNRVPVYYRIGPGFIARVDRIDYIVRDDENGLTVNEAPKAEGEFIELIGPNTVYELSPITTPRQPETPGSSQHEADNRIWQNMRIDTRIDGRIDTRIDTHIEPVEADVETR